MTLSEKVEKLNELCDRSLSISVYASRWCCDSYRDDSVLNRVKGGYIEGNTFEEMVDAALDYIEGSVIEINGKKYKLMSES